MTTPKTGEYTVPNPEWRRDESEGYPRYLPTADQTHNSEPIEYVYIQPGGCVEINGYDGNPDTPWMWHICDFPQFVAMMNSLLEAWLAHPERYE